MPRSSDNTIPQVVYDTDVRYIPKSISRSITVILNKEIPTVRP